MNRIAFLNLAAAALMTASVSSAGAAIVEDFESYELGEAANVANASAYSQTTAATPIGSIAEGISTANVSSSQVLEHDSAGAMATRATTSDLTGEVTLAFDFLIDSGSTHNVWVRHHGDAVNGVLIRMLEAGPGAPGQYWLQVQGANGSAPPAFQKLANYGHWMQATISLNIDADPSLGTFDIAFDDLTTGASLGASGPSGWWLGAAVTRLNQIQIESPSTGVAQFDNIDISVVPEPASLSLLVLGAAGLLARRR